MTAALRSIRTYFTDPAASKLTKFFGTAKGRDSSVKWLVSVSEIASETLKSVNACPDLIKGADSTQNALKDARVIFGLMNVLEGTFALLWKQIKKVHEVAKASINGAAVPVKQKRKEKENDSGVCKDVYKNAQGTTQLSLHFLSAVSDVIGTSTFAIAFGACRPIILARKHFGERVSESARTVGDQFGILMFINAVSGVVSGSANLARDFFIHSDLKNPTKLDAQDLFDSFVNNGLMIFEKSCEIGLSVINHFKVWAPTPVRLGLGLAGATTGLVRTWRSLEV